VNDLYFLECLKFLHSSLTPIHICSSAKESFKFLIQYLGTFLDEDASAINEKKEALYAIIAFVKAPDMFQVYLCSTEL